MVVRIPGAIISAESFMPFMLVAMSVGGVIAFAGMAVIVFWERKMLGLVISFLGALVYFTGLFVPLMLYLD